MLTQIHIRDFATIEQLNLSLPQHTTMITGETGAGKSIFLEAIELALGGRASAQTIRPGKNKAEISLCFDINHFSHVIDHLQAHDLFVSAEECIIRRIITSDGRSRCYINNTPVTVQFVKELGDLLFHFHSQHEQQILLKPDKQREILDRFADHFPLLQTVQEQARRYQHLQENIKDLQLKSQQRNERLTYLRFQLEELKALNLQDNEWQRLESEHKKQGHHEELIARMSTMIEALNDENEHSILKKLHLVRKTLELLITFEPKAKSWLNNVATAEIQLKDLTTELQHYLDHSDLNPEQMRLLEDRVSTIFNVARKYKITPEQLSAYTNELATEYQALNQYDATLQKLEVELAKIHVKYHAAAQCLSESRKQAAIKLASFITQTIRGLSLPHGEFSIAINITTDISQHGQDKICFQIKTNPDQPLQPLSKVISGGELSRLSLAAHLALAHKNNIPTLIFDEVDTGLSGAAAEKIGKLLRQLGESYQVFCVTHQAQIAACGQHHLLVEKQFINKVTQTRLRILSASEKKQEIARMLGGATITQTTLAHAEELLASQ